MTKKINTSGILKQYNKIWNSKEKACFLLKNQAIEILELKII